MIKKLTMAVVLCAALVTTSCSKSPQDYAKESFDIMTEYMDAIKTGDESKYKSLVEKENKLKKELDEIFKKDPKFKEEFMNAIDQYEGQFGDKFMETAGQMLQMYNLTPGDLDDYMDD